MIRSEKNVSLNHTHRTGPGSQFATNTVVSDTSTGTAIVTQTLGDQQYGIKVSEYLG